MAGRAHGSDYELHVFTEDGRTNIVAANNFNKSPNVSTDRVKRTGTTESDVDPTHDGWQVEAEFDRESFAADDLIDEQERRYYEGVPIRRMELVEIVTVPGMGGASRTYRYVNAVISDYSDDSGEQDDASTISITFETGKREEV
jgi:hypothetical protein